MINGISNAAIAWRLTLAQTAPAPARSAEAPEEDLSASARPDGRKHPMGKAIGAIVLSRETTIYGMIMPAGTRLTIKDGVYRTAEINGVKFSLDISKNDDDLPLILENGKVKKGQLAKAAVVNGVSLPAGTTYKTDDQGRFDIINVGKGRVRIGQRVYAAGSKIDFTEGKVYSGTLGAPLKLAKLELPTGTYIEIDENDKVNFATLPHPIAFRGIMITNYYQLDKICQHSYCPETEGIDLYPDGGVDTAELANRETRIGRFYFLGRNTVRDAYRSLIKFHPNDQVAFGTLSREAIVEGKKAPPRAVLEFDENGKPLVPTD